MRFITPFISIVSVSFIAALAGCVANEPEVRANSEGGYLFIDLEDPVAVGWTSEVIIFGPATGGQHCDEGVCYADHKSVEMEDILSSDESVIEVVGFEVEQFGEVQGIRVELKAHEEGEATLEFSFTAEEIFDEEGEELGLIEDAYSVESREVSFTRLARNLEGVDPIGAYGACPERGEGVYLMDTPGQYDVLVRMEKIDDRGNLLRGSGQFPFDIDPEEAVEVETALESLHQVRIRPKEYGTVTMTPQMGGDSFVNHFLSMSEVQMLEARAYGLSNQGGRGSEVVEFVEGRWFELVVRPAMGDAALCGGNLEVQVQSMTPAICEAAGQLESRPTEAIAVHFVGDCHLRLVAHGADIVQDLVVPVQHDW